MKNASLRIKVLSGLLCTGLAFSSTGIAFAAVNKDSASDKCVTSMGFKCPHHNKNADEARDKEMRITLEVVIKESISSNAITKTEGDKVLKYIDVAEKNSDNAKGGLFKNLVTEGILTKEKSDALREKMLGKTTEIETVQLKKSLNTLVVKKVITIDQSNKVQKVIKARHTERKEIYKKMKDMNEAERKTYMKKMENTKVSPMKVLIDNGTITKEQEIEIQKVLSQHNHGHHGHHNDK